MEDGEDRIREIAHLLWETSGRPSGEADRHWEQARQIYEAQRAAEVGRAPPSSVSPMSQSSVSLTRQSQMEVHMRNFDELVADAQKALALSLKEAFDAGRAHTASELKSRMAALFEDLISGPVATHSQPTPPPSHDHDGQNQHFEHTPS